MGFLINNLRSLQTSAPEADCVAAGGVVDGDACCDGACGVCGGSGCGARPGGGGNCCVGTITRSEVMCSENGGLPPCLIADPWTWRRYDGGSRAGNGENTWPVAKGNHVLYIHTLDDGVRLRNVKFSEGERGACKKDPQPPAVVLLRCCWPAAPRLLPCCPAAAAPRLPSGLRLPRGIELIKSSHKQSRVFRWLCR